PDDDRRPGSEPAAVQLAALLARWLEGRLCVSGSDGCDRGLALRFCWADRCAAPCALTRWPARGHLGRRCERRQGAARSRAEGRPADGHVERRRQASLRARRQRDVRHQPSQWQHDEARRRFVSRADCLGAVTAGPPSHLGSTARRAVRTSRYDGGMSPLRIGVLAVQGDFAEHIELLRRIGVEPVEVRLPEHLSAIDALIIPGGESTTIARLLDIYRLRDPIKRLGNEGMPIWGTCAGAIVLAKGAGDLDRPSLGLMDIDIRRNAFGRQVDSFEADLDVATLGGAPFHAIFIRAPVIEHTGDGVEVLATLADGTIVAVR